MHPEPVSFIGTTAVSSAVPFRFRLKVAVQEGVLIGVKWLIISLIALFGVGWFLNDYASIRDQARYVAQVRLAQQQQQQQARPTPAPTPAP